MVMRDVGKRLWCSLLNHLPHGDGAGHAVDGLPAGLDWEVLDELCVRHLHSRLESVEHVHLSSWKQTGCYRVFVRAGSGRCWSVIYKNSVYDTEQIPALAGLPICPGVPEWLVYGSQAGELGRYLPAVYHRAEVTPSVHYTYLLEDLAGGFETGSDSAWIMTVARTIPAIHKAMAEWSRRVGPERLLRYDSAFYDELQGFVWRNLELYLKATSSGAVSEMWSIRPSISAIYLREEFRTTPQQPIHGDFNLSNILRRRGRSDGMKIIDWEWAGVGHAHADLASLLKHAEADVEDRALRLYAGQDRRLSFEEHKRLYEWCKLGRALLDSAFLAVQCMRCPHKAVFDVHNHIRRSAANVMRICRQLGQAVAGVVFCAAIDLPSMSDLATDVLGLCC